MNKKNMHFLYAIMGALILFLSSCSSTEIPTPISSLDIDIVVPTEVPTASDPLSLNPTLSSNVEILALKENNIIIHVQGTGTNRSPIFEISETTPVQVKWGYGTADLFSLDLINADIASETDSKIISFNIANTNNQDNGTAGVVLPAGAYQISVEDATGVWDVQVLTPTQKIDTIAKEKELLKIRGESIGISTPFTIKNTFPIEISWNKNTADSFQVVLEWLDTEYDEDRFINLNFMNAQETGTIKIGLIPGEYQVIIINASLPWEITISQ